MAQVLLELVWEEDASTASGDQVPLHKVLPVNWLKQGLNLEEQQQVTIFMLFLVLTRNLVHRRQRLVALFKEEGTSTTRKTKLLGQWHTLQHHINSWREIQSIYMPGVLKPSMCVRLDRREGYHSNAGGCCCDRDETVSLVRPDLIRSIFWIPYIIGWESSSLYTCDTILRSVHYMIH